MILANSSDLIHFIGRFHPLLLHLPIGLISGWVVFEMWALKRKRRPRPTTAVLAALCALSATMAASSGFLLSRKESGFNPETLNLHLWLSLIFAWLCVVAAVLTWLSVRRKPTLVWPARICLMLAAGMLAPAAHQGGILSHGETYLTRYAPEATPRWMLRMLGTPIDEVAAPEVPEGPATVYHHVVQPLMYTYCGECHANGAAKGGFSIDSHEQVMEAIAAGDSSGSTLVSIMRLPPEDEAHMPPPDYPQPEALDIEAIAWWIDQGASEDLALLPDTLPAHLQAVAERAGVASVAEVSDTPEPAIAHADPELIKAVQDLGAIVQPMEARSPYLSVDLSGCGLTLQSEDLLTLAPLAAHIVELDLARCRQIDAAELAFLSEATALEKLNLRDTALDHQVLTHLSDLSSLRHLTLVGTQMSPDAVEILTSLPSLERLYVWRSGLDEAAVATLREGLVDCEVNDGTWVPAEVLTSPVLAVPHDLSGRDQALQTIVTQLQALAGWPQDELTDEAALPALDQVAQAALSLRGAYDAGSTPDRQVQWQQDASALALEALNAIQALQAGETLDRSALLATLNTGLSQLQ